MGTQTYTSDSQSSMLNIIPSLNMLGSIRISKCGKLFCDPDIISYIHSSYVYILEICLGSNLKRKYLLSLRFCARIALITYQKKNFFCEVLNQFYFQVASEWGKEEVLT